MFIGEYTNKIDQKRRLSVPSNFRKDLGEKAVITKGLDECLFLLPKGEWDKLAKKLSDLPFTQSDARGFSRMMLAGAMEVKIDKQGRILVPKYLKKYADLKKEAVIAGLYSRIEVWDKEKWKEYKQETEEEAGDMAERLKELGI